MIAGDNADPLAAVFAMLLALPWVALLHLLDQPPMWLSVVVVVAAMSLNFWLLRKLGRR